MGWESGHGASLPGRHPGTARRHTQRITVRDLILNSARAALRLQGDKGEFQPGHNGPWNVCEMPTRNTAHWSVALARAYELEPQDDLREAIARAGRYLLSSEARPGGYTYQLMRDKWFTNGIVGQAWVLEALLAVHRVLGDPAYLEAAEELVHLHELDARCGLWRGRELDGTPSAIHTTLNQQCWFTAMAHAVGDRAGNPIILERTRRAASMWRRVAAFNGRYIGLTVRPSIFFPHDIRAGYRLFRMLRRHAAEMDLRAKGYLAYSLYGMALFHTLEPALDIFADPRMQKMTASSLAFLEKAVYRYAAGDNRYGSSYNPIGFEMAYVLEVVPPELHPGPGLGVRQWIEKQLRDHLDPETMLMNRNTSDPNTLAAKICELSRVAALDLEVVIQPPDGGCEA
jgi:hypothetical protein